MSELRQSDESDDTAGWCCCAVMPMRDCLVHGEFPRVDSLTKSECECPHPTSAHDRLGLCLTCFQQGDRETTCLRTPPTQPTPSPDDLPCVAGEGGGGL